MNERGATPHVPALSRETPSLLRDVVQVLSFSIVSKGLIAVAGVLTIHIMSATEFARLTFCFSMIMAISQIIAGSFGRIYIVGHRKLALGDNVSSFLGLQFAALAGAGVALLPMIGMEGVLLPVVVVVLLCQGAGDFAQTFLQQERRFLAYSLAELLRCLAFLALLLLIATIMREVAAWYVVLLQGVTSAAAFLAVAGRHVNWRKVVNLSKGWALARQIVAGPYWYLFGYFGLLALFSQIDVWVLRGMSSDMELASYGAAHRYYSLLLLSLNAVHVVLLPRIQQLSRPNELREFFGKHLQASLLFLPFALALAFLSRWLIPWIDDGRYPVSISVFRVLAISATVSFAFSPYVNVLFRCHDLRFLFFLALAMTPTHLLATMVGARNMGAFGAAVANLVSYTVFTGAIYLRAKVLTRRPWSDDSSAADVACPPIS